MNSNPVQKLFSQRVNEKKFLKNLGEFSVKENVILTSQDGLTIADAHRENVVRKIGELKEMNKTNKSDQENSSTLPPLADGQQQGKNDNKRSIREQEDTIMPPAVSATSDIQPPKRLKGCPAEPTLLVGSNHLSPATVPAVDDKDEDNDDSQSNDRDDRVTGMERQRTEKTVKQLADNLAVSSSLQQIAAPRTTVTTTSSDSRHQDGRMSDEDEDLAFDRDVVLKLFFGEIAYPE